MKWKQIIVLVGLFGACGNIVAQDAKTPATIKPMKKQPVETVYKQSGFTGKEVIRQSFNPDQPAIIGIPAVVVDPNRPLR